MNCLDCTDYATALRSVARILNRDADDLRDDLSRFRLDEVSETERERCAPDQLIVRAIAGPVLPSGHATCWFHATRVPEDASFVEGLFPTVSAQHRVADTLGRIAIDGGLCEASEWPRLAKRGMEGPSRRGKGRSALNGPDAGPHGFLIRELILSGAVGACYLDAPELVSEFCGALPESIDEPLLAAYRSQTIPTIVKFRTTWSPTSGLAPAICYLYSKTHGEEPNYCGGGMSNFGVAIPPEDVLHVERLPRGWRCR